MYVNNELIGTVPDGGELIYQSLKKRLDTVYIQGGVPIEDRQEIDSQVGALSYSSFVAHVALSGISSLKTFGTSP